MTAARTKFIGCKIVVEELAPYLPEGVETETLDLGLHVRPEGLRDALQAAVDRSAGRFDTIILGYGLCSGAVAGVRANGCTLVVPRVDDCIAIFLGSRDAYREQTRSAPGTYYLTREWIEAGISPFADYDRMVSRWGRERADRMMGLMLKHYTRLALIRTGREAGLDPYREYARDVAGRFSLRFEEIPGSSVLLERMARGPWDEAFVVVPPGGVLQQEAFWGDVCNS